MLSFHYHRTTRLLIVPGTGCTQSTLKVRYVLAPNATLNLDASLQYAQLRYIIGKLPPIDNYAKSHYAVESNIGIENSFCP
ncbi:hypothetical protein VCHA37P192_110130 [Vibrio chagasii]|nr:hypothetical protein VCHA37P192_110130 [Vibrio chagasii]